MQLMETSDKDDQLDNMKYYVNSLFTILGQWRNVFLSNKNIGIWHIDQFFW